MFYDCRYVIFKNMIVLGEMSSASLELFFVLEKK